MTGALNRLVTLALPSLMVSVLTSIGAPPAQAVGCQPIQYSGGTGVTGDPFLIATPGNMQYLVATPTDWDKDFRLDASVIDLTGCTWTDVSVGDGGDPFTGTFDGAGNTIKGLTIEFDDAASTTVYAGIFGYIDADGVVKDLYLDGVSVTAVGVKQWIYTGAVAGYSRGTISNVRTAAGQVIADGQASVEPNAQAIAGGIVGAISGDAVVDRTVVEGTTRALGASSGSAASVAGGVVGVHLSSQEITSSQSAGAVIAQFGRAFSGGVIGQAAGPASNVSTSANVTAEGDADELAYAGGVVASATLGKSISGATGIGSLVWATGGMAYAGGIAGESDFAISRAWADTWVRALSTQVAGAAISGGITARQGAGPRSKILDSYSVAEVEATGYLPGIEAIAGGVAGYVGPGVSVENTGARRPVGGSVAAYSSGGTSTAGGLVGTNNGILDRSYAAAAVIARQDPVLGSDGLRGGLIGANVNPEDATASLWLEGTAPSATGSGTVTAAVKMSTAEATTITPYFEADWDITEGVNAGFVWNWCPRVNEGYPLNSFKFEAGSCATLSPATQNVSGTSGKAITPTAAYTAAYIGNPLTYSINPTLPAGLALDPASGVISGTPTVASPATQYTVTATDGSVAVTADVAITITNNVVPPRPVPRPPAAPGTPQGVAGDGSITVTWTAPATSGSSLVRSYQATANPGSASCTAPAPATSCTITGLTNGQPYTVTVTATSDSGTSPPSQPSTPITPVGPPTPTPTFITVTGQRAGKYAVARGTASPEMHGQYVTPWIRFPGSRNFAPGYPRVVAADGSFEWQRKTSRRVLIYFSIGSTLSPRIVIQSVAGAPRR